MRFIHDLCCGTVLVRKINYLSRCKAVVLIKVLSLHELFQPNIYSLCLYPFQK